MISFDAYMQSSEWLKQREFHSEAAAADPTFRAKNDDDPLNDYFPTIFCEQSNSARFFEGYIYDSEPL